jgi:hypothetical protein
VGVGEWAVGVVGCYGLIRRIDIGISCTYGSRQMAHTVCFRMLETLSTRDAEPIHHA